MAEYVPHWATPCYAPPAAAAATAQMSAGPAHADIAGNSVDELPAVALAESYSFLASAPYAPSYISYDVLSHSEWALDFLLGCSTTGVAFLIPS